MISIEVSKHAIFNSNGSPTHSSDNEIHVFTQFFVHSKPQRNIEIKHSLYSNYLNPYITRIHLLNERIYTNDELCDGKIEEQPDENAKLIQVNIGKRLSFKDVFTYIRQNKIAGYCVFTNADIFFDNSIQKLLYSTISTNRQMFALLRYEYRGEKDLTKLPIFGPRSDSQDTWIIHFSKVYDNSTTYVVESSLKIKENHEKAFDFEFGRPGCDNKFAYLISILGGEIINDPRFIKTYHYHTDTGRNYTNKDSVGQPYTCVCPAGFNPYLLKTLGCDMKNIIESTNGFQKIRFDDNNLLYNYIYNKLEKGEKFIIPRVSGHENNYAFFGKIIQYNIQNNIQPNIPIQIQYYFQSTIRIMKQNAGIKLSNVNSIVKYSNMYLRAFENCDIYAGWESWGHYIPHIAESHNFIVNTFSMKKIFWSFALDIFHYIYNRPFTTALKGKRILIVSPFEESIRSKLDIRDKLYDGVDLFPDCSFVFIKPPITNGDNSSEEFDIELETFFTQLNKLKGKYDVALLSCGGYANLIANYIYEKHNASSIYIGGVLQMYFGIYGVRWMKERPDILKIFLNNHWSRPLSSEKPKNFSSIESGCYW